MPNPRPAHHWGVALRVRERPLAAEMREQFASTWSVSVSSNTTQPTPNMIAPNHVEDCDRHHGNRRQLIPKLPLNRSPLAFRALQNP
jgi:hypothetical protein